LSKHTIKARYTIEAAFIGRLSMRRLVYMCLATVVVAGCGGGAGSGVAENGEEDGALGNFTFRAAATNPPVTTTSPFIAATGIKGVFSQVRLRDRAMSLDETRIYFAGIVMSGDYEIYSVNADGSNLARLTTSSGSDLEPSISPNGSKIAFISTRDGNSELYTMNVDGTGVTRMTSTASATESAPAWSPDSNKIVFSRSAGGSTILVTMNASTKAEGHLTLVGEQDNDPSYSPDGKAVVFTSTRNGNGVPNLFTVSATGGSPAPLTFPVTEDHYSPTYSPDGSQILFATNTTLYRMPAVYDAVRIAVTSSGGSVDGPVWAPDGSQVLTTQFISPYFRISRYTPEGTPLGQLLKPGVATDLIHPSWGPLAMDRTLISSGGGMLGTRAAGFIFTQSDSSTRSVLVFDCTTPTSAVITQQTGLSAASPNLVFSVDGDAISYMTYVNAIDWKPVRVIGTSQQPSASGALVSFSAGSGELVAVLPFSGSRAQGRPVVREEAGKVLYKGEFSAVIDAAGKNLAPEGASEVLIGSDGVIRVGS
jgi:WD40 repeat protein